MFEYLSGYEIDGSDTSFFVVMPDQEKIREVAEYFLEIPLFEEFGVGFEKDVWAPHRGEGIRNPKRPERIIQEIRDHEREAFYITAGCIHPSELEDPLKREIYGLSADRMKKHLQTGAELEEDSRDDHLYLGTGSCVPSVGLDSFYGDFVAALVVSYNKPEGAEEALDGYIINGDSYQETADQPGSIQFAITCGPSFLYEYAMYVINHLAARFPEFVFTGGLDCAGGFLYGCTYAASLYQYEVLTLEAGTEVNAVADLLTQLCEKGIIFHCYKPRNRKGDYSYQYYLSQEGQYCRINSGWEKPQNFTIGEYITYLSEVHLSGASLSVQKRECALMVLTRSVCKKNGQADWEWMAHVTAYCEDGVWMVELHVPYKERARLESLIDREG